MPDRLTDITAARTDLRDAERETRRIEAELARERGRLDDLRRRGETEELETALDRMDALRDERDTVADRLVDSRDRLEDLRDGVLDADEVDLFADLDTDLPIAMFPIRLETRFVDEDGQDRLLVRVYPDAIHSDSHETELTDTEVTWGEHFWRRTWRAGRRAAIESARDDATGEERETLSAELDAHEERVHAVWRQLVEGFGTERAAYIARTLAPTNPESRPDRPIDPDATLPVAPEFPSVPVSTEAWTRASRTELLPDRWIAVGYLDDERVFEERGPAIPDRLSTGPGPDPTVPTDDSDDEDLPPVDPGMRWLVDFDAAVDDGMGMRIPVSTDVADRGLDRLLVFGVKTSMTGEEGAERLTDLLDAHHYTDGLSFVPPGTPTNDTGESLPDADPSGSSYRVERGESLVADDVSTNGSLAARALGVDPSVFAHVEHADGVDALDARHMNSALWSVTWGYYLQQMFSGRLSRDRIKRARRHFVDHVRARGPLPTLRVGQQPYGLLPVTDSNQWTGVDPDVVSFLTNLRERFLRDGVPDVPRVSEEGGTVTDFLQMLSMHGASVAYVARFLLGRGFLSLAASERRIPGTDVDAWWRQHERRARRAVDALEEDWDGSLTDLLRRDGEWVLVASSVFLDDAALLDGPLVRGEVGGVGYIRWLLSASPTQIRNETFTSPHTRPSDSLLYLLLRHATLQEYANSTFDLFVDHGHIDPGLLVEPELVDVFPDRPTVTVWDLLNQPIGELVEEPIEGVAPETRIADALGLVTSGVSEHLAATANLSPGTTARSVVSPTRPALGSRDRPPSARFTPPFTTARTPFGSAREPGVPGTTFEAERVSTTVTSAGVERVQPHRVVGRFLGDLPELIRPTVPRSPQFNEFVGSLAYLSTRPPEALELLQSETLDLASHRLDAWITSFATRRLDEVREEQSTGVYVGGYGTVEDLRPAPDDESDGFLHAPSLTHASTGAILRSGYRSHEDTPLGDLLAVDLSSERVRLATALLDGVRQGQPLGALLGYRFERGLHEKHGGELDQYLPVLRELAPLAGEQVESESVPTESDPPSNVVDGLKLHERGTDVFADERLPTSGDDRLAIEREIDALGEALDAVRDAVTAEGVYQTVLGNPERAGATLEAIATGEVPPPELSFAETPREGVAHTHRLFVLFDETTDGETAWPTNDYQVRATAEPTLNAWIGSVLGDPGAVQCRAGFLDPETDEPLSPPGTVTVSLDVLELSPLDAVALADADATADRSELEERLVYHLLSTRSDDVPADAGVRLTFERDPTWEPDVVSVAEFLELARTLGEIVTSGRPADAADLTIPESDSSPAPDVAELATRADAARDALDGSHAVLSNVVATVETAVDAEETWKPLLEPLREALLRAAHLGVPGAVPASPAGASETDRDTLLRQARSIRDDLERTQERLAALDAPADPDADPAAARDHHVERLETVFGEDFRVLPRFSPPNSAELASTFAASDDLQGGEVDAAETWLGRWAHVRDNARSLRDLFTYERAMGHDDPSLTVGQLPHEEDDRWVALPSEGDDDPASKLSLVAHFPGTVATESIAGLFVDDWVETVPNESTTTGVTFHYDDPEARPPQAVLLAVRPDDRDAWDLDTLESTVLEAFDLAKLRMVDLETLPGLGQYLPALYFANNVEGDTIATDFTRLVREEE